MHLKWLLLAMMWTVRGPEGVKTDVEVDHAAVVQDSTFSPSIVRVASPSAPLGRVAADTAAFMREAPVDPALTPGILEGAGVSLEDVMRTLELVARIAEEDAKSGADRLSDPAFLAKTFRVVKWVPDKAQAASKKVKVDHRIRLTRYLVYESAGGPKSEQFNTALYQVPEDDEDCAEGAKPSRLKYTRQDVYAGVYEEGGAAAGGAKPLVWMSRRDVNRALMQGSVRVMPTDGSTPRVFNVHRNNGIAYDRGIRDSNLQGRYWYFREVDGFYGHGTETSRKIKVEPGVTVAGDIYNLGLGKLVMLSYGDTARLAVLADTGGAFQPNLYQLDWFSGVFPDHATFTEKTRDIPERVEASFLLAR